MTITFTMTTRVDCTEFVSFAIEKKTFNRMKEKLLCRYNMDAFLCAMAFRQ